MGKPSRTGLGRGLNSLLGNNNSQSNERTQNRDQVRYDEKTDKIIDLSGNTSSLEIQPPNITGKLTPVNVVQNDVSRETQINNNNEDVNKIVEEKQPEVTNSNMNKENKPSLLKIKDSENILLTVDIEQVEPNPEQPRTNFDPDDLRELSDSIKRNGLIQPILVRQLDTGNYQIIAGERRWQASQLAGISTIQVQVKDISDEKALEIALIENIQRADLNPIEEAYGYKRLMERNKMTQADIAQAVSKGRSTIANSLRLLELPEDAQQLLFEGKITAGHARAILSLNTKDDRSKLTQRIVDNNMSVRDAEALARLMQNKDISKTEKAPVPAVYKSVARTLKSILDTQVKIKTSNNKNRIEIEFKDERDLERIFEIINPE